MLSASVSVISVHPCRVSLVIRVSDSNQCYVSARVVIRVRVSTMIVKVSAGSNHCYNSNRGIC